MLAVEWPLQRATIGGAEPLRLHLRVSEESMHLNAMKQRVPICIDEYGRRAWESAVRATSIPRPSLVGHTDKVINRAYFKMREIMLSCSLPKPLFSLHLGEAPGGFVQAISEGALDKWSWKAVSLGREGAPQPMDALLPLQVGGFLKDLPHDGDLLEADCVERVIEDVGIGTTQLVTADGAVDMDHNRLEKEHFGLLVAQTNIALSCLEKGGYFVCKFFEGSMYETRLWIADVSTRFETVCIIKPTWSRSTNSERYLVARVFEGNREPLCKVGSLSKGWHDDVMNIINRMCEEQSKALEQALHYADITRKALSPR